VAPFQARIGKEQRRQLLQQPVGFETTYQQQIQGEAQAALPRKRLVALTMTALEAIRFNPLLGNFNCLLFLGMFNWLIKSVYYPKKCLT